MPWTWGLWGWHRMRVLMESVSPSRPREPDSTYFDLPQPSQGGAEPGGSAEAGVDVFQLQDVTTPTMVSGGCVQKAACMLLGCGHPV